MKQPKAGLPSLGVFGPAEAQATPELQDDLEEQEGTPPAALVPPPPSPLLLECPLCLLAQPAAAFPRLSACAHLACLACLQQYLRIEISESRVQLACPHCPAPLQTAEIHRLLLPEPALRDKYEEYLLRRHLAADPSTRWCPAPDCSYAVIACGCTECPRLVCGRQDCRMEFCYRCRQPWHPNSSCEQAWHEWSQQAPLGVMGLSMQLMGKEEMTATAATQDTDTIKACPRCGAFIMKINDGSCNRMNCTVCGCLFCWLCLREITDMHFLSPSGCTFWGKKPWSRTRKLLWQLGMVLGAPMVISLAAGIAVPVIMLGIPIYMGKKVLSHGRKSKLSGCQQCLSVASSVLLAVFVSPVITAITVGVGVPLMLTYVYGVVVLSLCRNRWGCGGARRKAGELSTVELENLAKLNELLAVLPTPLAAEVGSSDTLAVPSQSSRPCEEPWQEDRDSPPGSAGAGSPLSEARAISCRDGLHVVEVEVEIESGPPVTCMPSLSSAPSGHSFSADSLPYTSDGCSLAGVVTE
ncbi:E3 ubiquitin-protein ligase RNF19B-like isoform X2 [Rhineura floridana]|uniref:E3 ubiquitin-protein ligase RNF19B-like isoform X2 n=1 Tax=Rhineura floridana TaxID=261503 RepID=UPI002AC88A53|nr:E3 ubiquitin-protein ligase RNF19B-like isoform X2 [Rhineura floridana]